MTSPTITTEATSHREATPGLSTVEAAVYAGGETAAAARDTARDRAVTVRESVTAVSGDQIHTVELQVQATAEMFDPVTDAPFHATERLRIECVPETAETVVLEVTDAGGTVQTVQFGLHEDVHRKLQIEALAGAMERARKYAESIAEAEGLVVGEVQQVTTRDVSAGMESIVDEALAAGPDTDLRPTPVVVSAGVEVVYGLTEE